MKIGWKQLIAFVCLTAAIAFVLVTFGAAAGQIIQQVFGVHVDLTDNMTPQMIVAIVLVSMWPAAIITLAGTIFLFVFAQFASFDRDFKRPR